MRDFDAVIALGSNMGDKAANIARAIAHLTADGDIRVVRASPVYRTAPWGNEAQDWFLNACIAVATDLEPFALLARCQGIEERMGRLRTVRWGPRLIDLDILVCRDVALATPSLTLPHPRIAERAFVLVPLADIAPLLRIGGDTVTDLVRRIDTSGVAPAPA